MRHCLVTFCSIGLSTALLWHFILIAAYGKVIIQEPNSYVLLAEAMFMLAILVFSMVNAILLVKGK